MRVMTWNILNGGFDGADSARLECIESVISEHDPDVVVLQEAKHFELDGYARMHRLENAVDMRGFLAVAQTGQHVLVLIRRNQRVTSCFVDSKSFHHALVMLRLQLPDGNAMRVLGTHLCPHGALNRLLEAQRLTNYARRREHVVLMGDLNSPDHHNDHEHVIAQLPDHYRARYVMPAERTKPDTRVTATLEAAGFVDLAYSFGRGADRSTAPTQLVSAGGEFGDMRVDYIYASKRLASRVTHVEVIVNEATNRASDHYPLIADLGI